MSRVLPLAAPSFDEAEVEAVAEVVRSAWLTMGPRTAAFEEAFAERVGASHAVMASSCTAALHLAFAALDIGPGDEVIVPSLTFVATANAVAYTGATPRFGDILSLERPVLDPDAVAALIGPRTRAICAMHYGGWMGEIAALRALADRHGIALVEDAAHAPGASCAAGRAGSIGDVSCFSFFSNKNLVTGEGGMITTDDGGVAKRLRLMRAHGMTATSWDRERGHASGYDVVERGYNYRPSELEAALGLVQLGKLDDMTAGRRRVVAAYRAALAGQPELVIPFAGEDEGSACHILPIVAPSQEAREEIRRRAAEDDVQTSVHYQPVHRFTVYAPQDELPLTEEYARREVTVPLYPAMTDDDVERVARVLELQEAIA
ncbi:MAG: DegT/DnrJ/EryC1/StrS family aminotransferase [Thermoleophilia bacterium]